MAEDADESSKTEEPTEKKLSKAREEGNVPLSQEAKNLAMLIGALILVATVLPFLMHGIIEALVPFIRQPEEIPTDFEGLRRAITHTVVEVGLWLALPISILMLMAVLSITLQIGLLWTPKKLQPKLDALNPVSGIKKFVSPKRLAEFAKDLVKMTLVLGASGLLVIPQLDRILVTIDMDLVSTLEVAQTLVLLMMVAVVLVMIAVALIDVVYERHTHHTKLKMTRQEVKDEHKQAEGDPAVKNRIRSIRMQRFRERMMAAVPSASVVVTNPTHYAVAMTYDLETMMAPKLVAKGVDFLAVRIREVAEENDVPIIENPPLARALYDTVEIDQEIPPVHYQAVAEVIGYVMRLKGTAGRAAAGVGR